MADFYIRQGDTVADITDVLRDANGDPVQINGADVKFRLVSIRGDAPLLDDVTADNLDDGTEPLRGRVRFDDWTAQLTAEPGTYLGSWTVTFANSDVMTFPNTGYIAVEITPDQPVAAGRYVAIEELKKTLSLSDRDHADRDLEVAIASAAEVLEEEYGGPWELGPVAEAKFFTPQHGLTTVSLHPELIAVDAVELDTGLNGEYLLTLTEGVDYALEPAGSGPWDTLRFLRSGVAWAWEYDPYLSPYPWGRDGLRITGQWGSSTTPAGVKAAATIVATRIFRRMREAPFGVLGVGPEGSVVRAGDIAKDPDIRALMKKPSEKRPLIV